MGKRWQELDSHLGCWDPLINLKSSLQICFTLNKWFCFANCLLSFRKIIWGMTNVPYWVCAYWLSFFFIGVPAVDYLCTLVSSLLKSKESCDSVDWSGEASQINIKGTSGKNSVVLQTICSIKLVVIVFRWNFVDFLANFNRCGKIRIKAKLRYLLYKRLHSWR